MNLNNVAVSSPPLVVDQALVDRYRLISQNPDVNIWSTLDAALPSVKEELASLIGCDSMEAATSASTRVAHGFVTLSQRP